MDAFFAAVEQRDFPEYRGRPIAVGGNKKRGVVAAASYEARKYGVHSAMPSAQAAKLCPDLIFVKSRFGVYKQVSEEVMSIFQRYTDLIQPMSLDEAYLDVGEYSDSQRKSPVEIASQIRSEIEKETGLTASAGISFNKFLAKIASDYNKPNGQFEIDADSADFFLRKLPIKKIPGIGAATANSMRSFGIENGADILNKELSFLEDKWGKRGKFFYHLLRGEYYSPIVPERVRKSLGAERTFENDISDINAMNGILEVIAERVANELQRKMLAGRTITLKIKLHDFTLTTRGFTLSHPTNSHVEISEIVKKLLVYPIAPQAPVRLLGISISNLISDSSNAGFQTVMKFGES